MPAADADITNNIDFNNTTFAIKDKKLYVPVVTLLARDNQEVSKFLSKGFERSVYWNEYKTKSENRNTTNEFRYFIKSNFVGVNKLFALVYPNRNNDVRRFNAQKDLFYQKV